jgi:cytochrome b561
MFKIIVHWLVAISVVIQLVAFIFTGQIDLPEFPW